MTRAAWIAQQHGRKAVLYVVRVYGPGESFYKVGVTFSLSSRFSRLKTLYRWRTVARYSSYNAGAVYDLEQRLHREFSALSYAPLADFGGRTECYSEVGPLLAALPSGTFFLKNTETLI
ncbi:GIY-YIG nuclease family protein [Hymenobacter cheonanensis]|uniref:GIY-YIG nuclease family protein n=1 Tax=Hymenobacter sp. CA2-7 TaxID=3063993 RepID=UPI0027123B42|nr:GIY-YIG nuclease family protein [Hymenobacter sp. CA2-7]MDO7888171.1 GIY-YIG nuclease family protein [Hymenobacter sp. CA2-7]